MPRHTMDPAWCRWCNDYTDHEFCKNRPRPADYHKAVRDSIKVIKALAKQQAMPDDWYQEHLSELEFLIHGKESKDA